MSENHVDFGKAKGKPQTMSFAEFKHQVCRLAAIEKRSHCVPGDNDLFVLWEKGGNFFSHAQGAKQKWTLLEIIDIVREHCTPEAQKKRHQNG